MVSLQSTHLVDFLRARGATVHESLELFGRRSGLVNERGAFAVAPIKKGELLLRLPAAAVMRACENGAECEWMPQAARDASPSRPVVPPRKCAARRDTYTVESTVQY